MTCTSHRSKGWLTDHDLKEQRSRERHCRRKVEGAQPDQGIVQLSPLGWIVERLFPDPKREIAIDLVGIGRHCPPLHGIDTRFQGWERHPHDRAVSLVDVRINLVDLLASGIADDGRTERRLQSLVELERDFVWWRFDCCPFCGGGADKLSVRERDHSSRQG